MKVTEKKLDDGHVLLEAIASTAEVGHALTMAQYGFAQKMGLRPEPGKSVAQLAEERLGVKDLDSLVQQQAVEYLVPFAVDKRNIVPAYPPQPQAAAPLKRGQTFSFELRVAMKPDYELTGYEPVTITVPPFALDDAEVDAQIAQLADNYATFEADEPRPVQAGDSFLLALEASQNGEKIENLSTEGRTYVTNMNLMPPSFEAQLIGMSVGEPKTFSFEMPSGGPGAEADVIDCTATVKEMQKKVVPAIDDAWIAENMPMYRDAAALRSSIADRMAEDRRAQYESLKLQTAAAELAKRFKGRIEDPVYEATQRNLVGSIRARLAQQGVPFEQFVQSQGGEQQFGMIMMLQTRATLTQGYALDALFRHEKMTLDEADLDEAAKAMNPQNPAAARREMEENGRGFALRELAQRIKANRWLLDHAEVIVKDPAEQQGEGRQAAEQGEEGAPAAAASAKGPQAEKAGKADSAEPAQPERSAKAAASESSTKDEPSA